ncbi:MAG: UDP-glucose 4-epimerase-like protein [Chloroflexota bacterium]|nr:MAG: UDP-glucose 4-epimerase-like protein [Chloroflexota bacterium]
MAFCLVTGGAGFIGSHLVEVLLAQGQQVRVLDNLSTGRRANLAGVMDQIEFVEGTIEDQATVARAVAGVEVVFHLAAIVSVPHSMAEPAQTELINTLGTLNLLQAARTAGVRRLVLSSTCAIYGDDPTLPKTETMRPQPKSPYAVSKLAAEHYCQIFWEAFGLETVVLRYFNVFGPRQDPSSPYSGVISIFVDKLSQGAVPTIFGDGRQTRDFVSVEDVVQANLLAATVPQAAGNTLNIGTGYPVSIRQLFEALRQIFECEVTPTYGPARSGDVLHSYADSSQAKAILGWKPQVTLEAGLKYLVTI